MKIWHAPALAGVFLVVGGCNGMTSVGGEGGAAGEGDDGMGGTAGRGGSSMTGGSSTTGGSSMTGGMSGTSGASGSGGAPNPCAGKPCGAECYSCSAMADPAQGMGAPIPCDLAQRYCGANGECTTAFPVCENECETSMDCGVIDIACQTCADGSVQCPSAECQMGRCVSTYPTCATECMSDAGCAMIAAPCQMCPDGTTSCPKAECLMGRCSTSWPGCGGDDPCDGRECGEPCNPTCADMNCGMIADVAFSCNADGKCAAEAPRCGPQCETAMDCPETDLCFMCLGGTCGDMDCVSGNCQFVCPPVEPPDPECMSADDCVADAICRYCPDMSCAEIACINSECKSVCPL